MVMAPPPLSTLATHLLLLLPLLLLPPPRVAAGADEPCLANLYKSLQYPPVLRNWTPAAFAAPCDGFTSYLEGATCNNGRVLRLSLPNLALAGTISPFLANCSNLQSLDLSSNSLSGSIPAELRLLSNLASLNLSRNRLSGRIPPDLALCSFLSVLDLHSNFLAGPIPDQLGLIPRLAFLDVSDNLLEGPVPAMLANSSSTGLPRFNQSSFAGNRGLYGYPLGPPRGRRSFSVAEIVGIGLGSGMLSLVLSFTVVCVWLRLTEDGRAGEEAKVAAQYLPEY